MLWYEEANHAQEKICPSSTWLVQYTLAWQYLNPTSTVFLNGGSSKGCSCPATHPSCVRKYCKWAFPSFTKNHFSMQFCMLIWNHHTSFFFCCYLQLLFFYSLVSWGTRGVTLTSQLGRFCHRPRVLGIAPGNKVTLIHLTLVKMSTIRKIGRNRKIKYAL